MVSCMAHICSLVRFSRSPNTTFYYTQYRHWHCHCLVFENKSTTTTPTGSEHTLCPCAQKPIWFISTVLESIHLAENKKQTHKTNSLTHTHATHPETHNGIIDAVLPFLCDQSLRLTTKSVFFDCIAHIFATNPCSMLMVSLRVQINCQNNNSNQSNSKKTRNSIANYCAVYKKMCPYVHCPMFNFNDCVVVFVVSFIHYALSVFVNVSQWSHLLAIH